MAYKLLCILLISILSVGLYSQNSSTAKINIPLISQTQAPGYSGNLKILNMRTTMRPGEMGYITIQGRPGVKYTIKTSFKKGDRTFHVMQWRTAGADGTVTFNWDVSSDTIPGSNSAIISGGGESLNLSHTVLK